MNLKQNVTSRRGRPKSAEKRELISEAAAHLFLTEGFERTSMDSIAAYAGVSKQTVYSHFANKEELFRNCIIGKVEEYQLTLGADRRLGLEDGLSKMADRFLRLISDERVIAMWRLLIGGAASHQQMARMYYETGPGETLGSLAKFLQVHEDKLACEDYDEAARTFISLVSGQHQMIVLLGLANEVSAEERAAQAARSVEQFLAIYQK